MRKALGLSSQDGSELIGYMLKDKLINRTLITTEGKRTFLLERRNGNGHSKKTDYSVLLSGGKFSPCSGCEKDCVPAYCNPSLSKILQKNQQNQYLKTKLTS